jgi:hypothetical protein
MNFFKDHWLGIFISSVVAGLVTTFLYEHVSLNKVLAFMSALQATSSPAKRVEPSSLEIPRLSSPAPKVSPPEILEPDSRPSLRTTDVVTDSRTRLMWQDDDYTDTKIDGVAYWSSEPSGKLQDWDGAVRYCRELRLAGFDDWRLPNIEELQSAHEIKAKFKHVKPNRYWSSTLKDLNLHWYVLFTNGQRDYNYAPWYTLYVRCVRTVG